MFCGRPHRTRACSRHLKQKWFFLFAHPSKTRNRAWPVQRFRSTIFQPGHSESGTNFLARLRSLPAGSWTRLWRRPCVHVTMHIMKLGAFTLAIITQTNVYVNGFTCVSVFQLHYTRCDCRHHRQNTVFCVEQSPRHYWSSNPLWWLTVLGMWAAAPPLPIWRGEMPQGQRGEQWRAAWWPRDGDSNEHAYSKPAEVKKTVVKLQGKYCLFCPVSFHLNDQTRCCLHIVFSTSTTNDCWRRVFSFFLSLEY